MNKKLAIGLIMLVAAVIAFAPLPKMSAHAAGDFAKTSKAAIMIDADTGAVVYEKNATERLPIASMVKIMTLCVAFDEIEARGISLDSEVVASENASAMGGSQAFIDANASYRLDELLKSIVVASANDSCVAVAEYLYGSVDAFVDEMNKKAAALGMDNTVFVNCTGLPKPGQYCCAADVVKMFSALARHQKFFEYAGVWMYDFAHPSGRTTQLTNTNKLIKFYDGCDGGKTGYTDEARSCITVTAKRGNTRLICTVIGAENSKTRNAEVAELLNYGFANYKTEVAIKEGDVVGEYKVARGKSDITGVCGKTVTAFVKCGEKSEITTETVVGELKAPINAGDVIGEIIVYVDGAEHARAPVVAQNGCEKEGYIDIVDRFIEAW